MVSEPNHNCTEIHFGREKKPFVSPDCNLTAPQIEDHSVCVGAGGVAYRQWKWHLYSEKNLVMSLSEPVITPEPVMSCLCLRFSASLLSFSPFFFFPFRLLASYQWINPDALDVKLWCRVMTQLNHKSLNHRLHYRCSLPEKRRTFW